MYFNDVENVFHQHLIIIKVVYFMSHKVGKGLYESSPKCPCFKCAIFFKNMTMVANNEAITKNILLQFLSFNFGSRLIFLPSSSSTSF